jgi:class 3 adenylate cyclase
MVLVSPLFNADHARHRPEQTLLYRIVAQHYPAFVALLAGQGRPLPDYVREEFEAYLKCGRLEHGLLRVRCESCHAEHLVAFSCKRRGFCLSCGARRMAESAALLVDEVFPEQPVRQWVLSVPSPLRFLFAARPDIMGAVLRIVYSRQQAESDRVLATVLFTDIVAGTERAAALGDRRWRDLLNSYYALVRGELVRHRGREIDTAGDGFLAAFDGPARAVRCASAIVAGVRSLGIEVRAGLHTGECEVIGDKVGGIAVHIGARVAALAGPNEVLVSSTVKDLVAGSGLTFGDRGVQPLKGVPGEWRLFAMDR